MDQLSSSLSDESNAATCVGIHPLTTSNHLVVSSDTDANSNLCSDRPRALQASKAPERQKHRWLNQLHAVLYKNWLLKKANWGTTCLEIVTPAIFLLLLLVAQAIIGETHLQPAGWSDIVDHDAPRNATTANGLTNDSFNLFSVQPTRRLATGVKVPRFVASESTMTGLLSFLNALTAQEAQIQPAIQNASIQQDCMQRIHQNANPTKVPSECGDLVSPYKLAIIPDSTFTRNYFVGALSHWYPQVNLTTPGGKYLTVPSLKDSTVFFKDAQELEQYITSKQYGAGTNQPRVFAAIVFQEFPSEESKIGLPTSIEYSIRMNATAPTFSSIRRQDELSDVPGSHSADLFRLLERRLITTDYQRFATNGFMTLQTLVTRFVNCQPTWDPVLKSTNGSCQKHEANFTETPGSQISLFKSHFDGVLQKVLQNDALLQHSWRQMVALANPNGLASGEGGNLQIDSLPVSVQDALMQPLRLVPQPVFGAQVAPLPVSPFKYMDFYEKIRRFFLPIWVIGSFGCGLVLMVIGVMTDKRNGVTDHFRLLGISSLVLGGGWLMTYVIISFAIACLQMTVCVVGLFTYTNLVSLFGFWWLFNMATFCFGLFMTALFEDVVMACLTSVLLYFGMALLDSLDLKLWPSLILVQTLDQLALSQTTHFDTPSQEAVSSALPWLWLQIVFYLGLWWYCDKIVPRNTFRASFPTQKWYFPVTEVVNRFSSKSESSSSDCGISSQLSVGGPVPDGVMHFEEHTEKMQHSIERGEVLSLERLAHSFARSHGSLIALEPTTLALCPGQIGCFVGKDDSGRSTLIGLLSGQYRIAHGDVFLNGVSLKHNIASVRESLGLFLGHNVVYGGLSVEENLLILGLLKGLSGAELVAEVEHKLSQGDLLTKRFTLVHELSSSVQRRLCIVASFLGNPQLVLLDEPTQGIDAYNRRSVLEFLDRMRHDRVILFTSGDVQEADQIADRMGVLHRGRLYCFGSSQFLKNQFATGYTLRFIREPAKKKTGVSTTRTDLKDFLLNRMPEAKLLSEHYQEIVFRLPDGACDQFEALFCYLDECLDQFGILGYEIDATTLDQVFDQVASSGDLPEKTLELEGISTDSMSHNSDTLHQTSRGIQLNASEALTGFGLVWWQVKAVVWKRLLMTRRDSKNLVMFVVFPLLALLVTFITLNMRQTHQYGHEPAFELSMNSVIPHMPSVFVSLGDPLIVPYHCYANGSTNENQEDVKAREKWCTQLFQTNANLFVGEKTAIFREADIPAPPDDSSPTVAFNVSYGNASQLNQYRVDGSESLVLLRMSQRLHEQATGKVHNSDKMILPNQFGAYLVYANPTQHVVGYDLLVNTSLSHSSVLFKAQMDQAPAQQ